MTILKQRAVFYGRMGKGGYMQSYEIRDGDDVVGTKTVYRANRNKKETTSYRLGEREFYDVRDFIAAYEKTKCQTK
jgi:hypothetical protein